MKAICFVVGNHVNGFAGFRVHTEHCVDEASHITSNGNGGGVVGNVLCVSSEMWVEVAVLQHECTNVAEGKCTVVAVWQVEVELKFREAVCGAK